MKNKIIIFANTIWFLDKFKYELIESLSKTNIIECLYLRIGPFIDIKRKKVLEKKGINFKKVDLKFIINQLFNNLNSKKIKNERIFIRNIIVFTIGPILISSVIFAPFNEKIIIVLEGLGRVFSSRLIFYRFLKRFVQKIYKIIFSKCKYVLTLNYSDAAYLAEMNIAPISKINTIPGTGIDINYLKDSQKRFDKTPKYIDFIARSLPEKGFYDFIYMREYLLRHNKKLADNNPFRIITPSSDIDLLIKRETDFVKKSGIIIKPYISNPLEYYRESKVIILPTSYGEGISRVVLESIYLSIPLLVSRNQGTEEILPINYKYFTISKNPSVLIGQLIEILNDNEYIEKIFKKQKLIIEKFYSTTNSIKVFESFLN
tara:strand:- start:2421 stop:3542 length:1122 start_codon:yes stop_codon:yes gene_type:complete